jgi:hypothetical protein
VLVRFPAMMWGILFVGLGVACYMGGVLLAAARHLLAPWLPADEIVRMVLWYSGMPVVAGFLLIVFEVVALVPRKRRVTEVVFDPIENRTMTVVLTVYNDGESIGASVRDFRGTPWFAG